MSESLAEAYPIEMQRCQEVLAQYRAIGKAGAFGALMITDMLIRAQKAVAEADTVAMIRLYQEMQETK